MLTVAYVAVFRGLATHCIAFRIMTREEDTTWAEKHVEETMQITYSHTKLL